MKLSRVVAILTPSLSYHTINRCSANTLSARQWKTLFECLFSVFPLKLIHGIWILFSFSFFSWNRKTELKLNLVLNFRFWKITVEIEVRISFWISFVMLIEKEASILHSFANWDVTKSFEGLEGSNIWTRKGTMLDLFWRDVYPQFSCWKTSASKIFVLHMASSVLWENCYD